MLKPISGERPNRSGWNLVRRSIGIKRIQENCFRDACISRARHTREKRVFGGSQKSCFSKITFFLVDMRENSQSKVCSASDARNFGTKFVGIEALWPRQKPESSYTTTRTYHSVHWPTAFLNGRIELISVPINCKMFGDVPSKTLFFDPGPCWPAMARQTQKTAFFAFLSTKCF